jgi:hypothetical protein
MKVCEEAEDMIAAGAVGGSLHEAFRHAAELLDVADEELQVVDLPHYMMMAAASYRLRAKLRVLRDTIH